LVHLVQVPLEITLLIEVATDLMVNQPGCAHAVSSNPTASGEPSCHRVRQERWCKSIRELRPYYCRYVHCWNCPRLRPPRFMTSAG